MKKVALWAINGVGLGHTVRVALLMSELHQLGLTIKIICENTKQLAFFPALDDRIEILVAPRPWKVVESEKVQAEATIRYFLKDVDGIIADMFSVPRKEDLESLLPKGIKPIFLIHWMTRGRWNGVVERLVRYDGAKAIVVLPQPFFEGYMGGPISGLTLLENRVQFLRGFIPRLLPASRIEGIGKNSRIAFCCGAGGVHSEKGMIELEEAMYGVCLAKKRSRNLIAIDAMVGNNEALRLLALKSGVFDRVFSTIDNMIPQWDEYQIIVGRCGFTSFVEIMATRAILITCLFESDGEWDLSGLEFLKRFGVECVNKIQRESIAEAIILAADKYNEGIEGVVDNRKSVFKRDLEGLVSQVLALI